MKTYLVLMEESEDTETEWFDQIVDALDDKGITSTVLEVEQADQMGFNTGTLSEQLLRKCTMTVTKLLALVTLCI